MNLTLKDKIGLFFKNNLKIIIFTIIFLLIYTTYNLNNPYTDYFFKRGVKLEYSINKNSNLNLDELKQNIENLKIKTGEIKNQDGILSIELYYLAKEKNTTIYNKISDYIFDSHIDSKLIEVETLNEHYDSPYSQFVLIMIMIIISLIACKLLCLFIPKKYFPEENTRKISKEIEQDANIEINQKEPQYKKIFKKIKDSIIHFFFEEDFDKNNTNITKEIIDTIVFVLIAVILIRLLIGELRWIPSGSMKPTILERDRVFVEKLHIPEKQIKRGDILVFYPPETELSHNPLAVLSRLTGIFCKDIAYIKRVIGMPNDKFEIKYDYKKDEYKVFINDIALKEPYIMSKSDWSSCNHPAVKFCGPFTIPKNNYFMMGDNRGNSQDSRFWGFLPEERIIGRAKFMFWPFKRINSMKDRYYKLHQQKNNDKYLEYNYILNRY